MSGALHTGRFLAGIDAKTRGWLRSHLHGRAVSAAFIAVAAILFMATAQATAYRCEVDGKTIYSDAPCAFGRQTGVIDDDASVGPADRAAAAARLQADKKTLADLDRRRAQAFREDQRAAERTAKRGKSTRPCVKLELRARRAHDDFSHAAPKDQDKARVKMQRAEDDYSALCKR